MKILFVNSSLTDGGSERAMSLVAGQMAGFGYDVEMLLLRDKKKTYSIDPRIEVVQLSYSSTSKSVILIERLRKIRSTVKESKADCVITFMWDLNVMVLAATIGLKTQKVISERAYPGSSHRTKVSRILERAFYRFADVIVYQTEDARSFCPQALLEKSRVIPNIVMKPVIEPYSGIRDKRIVSVGRLTEQKNFPLLIKAFSMFAKTNPDYILEIYGEGSLKTALRSLSRDLGISKSVVFKGYVCNIAEEIRNACMFVLPSNYEGISNAITEAMAMGIPTICTDCPAGGAAMMIESGVNGLLVPVGDDVKLARAMIRVADDDVLARNFSRNAKEVATRFSADKIGRMWEEVIDVAR